MNELVEIRAIVRPEMLDRVVHQMKEAGARRLTVERVHAIGSGVDPATSRFSLEEGSAYADMARVSLVCSGEMSGMYVELIQRTAQTGRRGDGIITTHPVLGVNRIRTGATGHEALS